MILMHRVLLTFECVFTSPSSVAHRFRLSQKNVNEWVYMRVLFTSAKEEGIFFHQVLCKHCWVGRQNGHPACIKVDVGLLVVTIWLELCTPYSSSSHHSPSPSSLLQ